MGVGQTLRALRQWFDSSLWRKFVGLLGLVMIVLSLGFLVLLSNFYHWRVAAEQERAAAQFNDLFQTALENAMLKRDLHGLQAILSDMNNTPGIDAIHVLNPALVVQFSSHAEAVGEQMDSPVMRDALAVDPSKTRILSIGPRSDLVRAVTAVPNRSECRGCHGPASENPINGVLVVDYDAGSLGGEAGRTAAILATMGAVVIAATSLAVWWALSRTVLKPVSALTAAMQNLQASGLRDRVEIESADEIGRLGAGFNALAGDLQESMKALQHSEGRLQAVIDAIPDGVRVIGRDHRVVLANSAYVAHVGKSPDQIIGQPCHVLSHGSLTPCRETLVRCPLVELGPETPGLTCRQIHLVEGGREAHVEVAAALLDLSTPDMPGGCIVEAIRDLDRQAQLGQEHRLAELGLLAAGLAHEIYNPLSSINLLLAAIEQDAGVEGAPRTDNRLGLLRREIDRTLELTNSLLTLCQPPGDATLVRVDEVVPQALEILQFEADKAGATLTSDISPDLRLLVAESDLRLAVTNLVSNALHAVTGKGEVTVSAQRREGRIRIVVADNGCGVSKSDLRRLVLPFWTRRADRSQGRGLGLTLVQAAMDRCGGRLEIESILGSGSRFILDYPDPDSKRSELS